MGETPPPPPPHPFHPLLPHLCLCLLLMLSWIWCCIYIYMGVCVRAHHCHIYVCVWVRTIACMCVCVCAHHCVHVCVCAYRVCASLCTWECNRMLVSPVHLIIKLFHAICSCYISVLFFLFCFVLSLKKQTEQTKQQLQVIIDVDWI